MAAGVEVALRDGFPPVFPIACVTIPPMTIRLAIAARTDVGRVRQANEDAFLVADLVEGPLEATPEAGVVRFEVGARGAILAVSDGMGGHRAGDVASAMSLESLYRGLSERT